MRASAARLLVPFRRDPGCGLLGRMMNNRRFEPDAIWRRARLYSRQIAIAVLLTAVAVSFLVSASVGPRSGPSVAVDQYSSVAR